MSYEIYRNQKENKYSYHDWHKVLYVDAIEYKKRSQAVRPRRQTSAPIDKNLPTPALTRASLKAPLVLSHKENADLFMTRAGISDEESRRYGAYFLQRTEAWLLENTAKNGADVAESTEAAIDKIQDPRFIQSLVKLSRNICAQESAYNSEGGAVELSPKEFLASCRRRAGFAVAAATEITFSAIGISDGHLSSVIGATAMAVIAGGFTHIALGNEV